MEETDQRNEKIVSPEPEVKFVTLVEQWNVRKRLYPPFRERRRKIVRAKEDEQLGKKVNESSVPETKIKFRLTMCLRKKQFPFVCINIPLDNDKILTTFDTTDTSCVTPICSQDNKPCLITHGISHSNDVCQDGNKSTENDRFGLVSDRVNESESQCYITTDCDESIDYVICENCNGELSSSTLTTHTKDTDDALFEYLNAREYSGEFREEYYERFSSTSEQEAKPNSEFRQNSKLLQDPLVSHRLTIPYKEMPLSRYCHRGSFNDFQKIIFLAKRPRSPVRNIPEGRFDVLARIAEVTKRTEIHNSKHVLQISKESIATTKTSSFTSPLSDSNQEPLTALIQVLLDDVKLSFSEYENDLSMTLTTIWAIKEFSMSKTGSKITQSITITNLGIIPKAKRSLSYNLTLLTADYFDQTFNVGYPPRGSGNHSLHRAIPWDYLCAAHTEGEQKSYDTVRTCIDKFTTSIELKKSRVEYLPDISCLHI